MPNSWPAILKLSLWMIVGGGCLSSCSPLVSHTYEPSSPKIKQLAIDTTMTLKAQQLFYQQKPRIESKRTFHQLCRKVGHNPEKTIILGCFTSNGYRGNIIIQSVTDSRLAGMMEMVAAHEMLHAAYQKMSSKERARLAPKLKQAAQRVTDEQLLTVLKDYEAGDPEIYVNELHSHLGTTLANLGDPALETHYQQFFRDRKQVVAFAQRSRRVLNQIDAQVQQLEPELNTLEANLKAEKESIQRTEADLKASFQDLERMKSNLADLKQRAEASLRQGDYGLADSFEQQRSHFNTAVQDYNWQVETLQNRITQFNQQFATYSQKVDAYNQLAATNRSILSAIKLDRSGVQPVSP